MRGEYCRGLGLALRSRELPPRARRIPVFMVIPHHPHGTTSACAENTGFVDAHPPGHGNYLRVRGEYLFKTISDRLSAELPPRARRIPMAKPWTDHNTGTTSACAENTQFRLRTTYPHGNYLRVRGEYGRIWKFPLLKMELPPRARRIPHPEYHSPHGSRTTSACAENTGNGHR